MPSPREFCAPMKRLVLALAMTVSLMMVSAAQVNGKPEIPLPNPANQFPDKASARIVISQDDQQMLIYDGAQLVRALPVSTGWPGIRKTTTPVWSGRIGEYWGSFESFGTIQDHGYWLFTDHLADGSWNGDILIHGAPYHLGPTGQKEYELDGIGQSPASNGCIRMEPADADWFTQWNPIGVPISILPFTHGTGAYPKLAFGAALVASTQTMTPTVAGLGPHP